MKTKEVDISEESQCASAAGDFKPAARRTLPARMFSQATVSFRRTYVWSNLSAMRRWQDSPQDSQIPLRKPSRHLSNYN